MIQLAAFLVSDQVDTKVELTILLNLIWKPEFLRPKTKIHTIVIIISAEYGQYNTHKYNTKYAWITKPLGRRHFARPRKRRTDQLHLRGLGTDK
jgi:hypothetical protein